jgi:hypothetical protein
MLTSLLSEVTEFLKAATDKVFVGFLYGVGGLLGLHAASFVLHFIGVTSTLSF